MLFFWVHNNLSIKHGVAVGDGTPESALSFFSIIDNDFFVGPTLV